jgi:hypothetical protein
MPLATPEHIPYPAIIRLLILHQVHQLPLTGPYADLLQTVKSQLLTHLQQLALFL